MLILKPNCECCDKDLPPDATDARICTFECTFCADCGGEQVRRPIRPAAKLMTAPASTKRLVKHHAACTAGATMRGQSQ